MAASAGSVLLDILPNVSGLSTKMREAASVAAKEASAGAVITPKVDGTAAGQRFGSGFLAEAKKVAIAAGALFAAKEIVDFGKDSISAFTGAAKSALTLNRAIGGTVEDSSRLIFAANESGVSTDRFSTSMKLLEKNVVSIGGKAPIGAKALAQIGVDANDAHGKLKPMAELLPDIAEKFAAMPAGAEKSALAIKLFGKGGLELLPFLNKGKEGIAELTAESDKYGHTISGPQAAAVKANIVAQRQFNAALEGVKIQLGAQLLPVVTTFTNYFRTSLLPAILSVTAFLKTHSDAIVTVAKVLIPLVLGYALFVGAVGKAKEGIKAFQEVHKALGAVMESVRVKQILEGAKSFVTYAAQAVAQAARASAAWVASSARTVALWVAQGAVAVAQGAIAAGAWVASSARTVAALALQGAAFVAQKVVTAASAVATGVMTAAQWALNAALDANPIGLIIIVLAALVAALIFAYTHSQTFRDIVSAAWAAISGAVKAAWEGVILPAVQAMVGFWNNVLGPAISFLYHGVIQPVWAAISAVISGYINTVRAVISGVLQAITGNWSGAWGTLQGVVSGAWSAVVGAVQGGIGTVLGLVGGLGGRILGALGNLGGLLSGAGRALIQGLIGGITSMIGNVAGAMGGIAQTIKDHLPGSPVKTGPLTSWNNGGAGVRLMRQLADGITSQADTVAAAAAHVAGGIADATTAPAYTLGGRSGSLPGKGAAAAATVTINGNVGWDPLEVAQQVANQQRKAMAVQSLTSVAF